MKFFIIYLLAVGVLFSAEKSCETDSIQNTKTKSSMERWLDGNFGLKPHKVNYILPYAYRSDAYQSYVSSITYSNIEAELQVSLKLQIANDLLGLNEKYYLAYTQQAFWQLYIDSAPFRESLYNPEAFLEFPIRDSDSFFGLRSLIVGYAHKSNGQPNTENIPDVRGNLSRSVNYIYTTLRMQHKTLVTDITLWVPISDLDDNPDLMEYSGYSSLKFTYFLNGHMFTLMGRGNFETLNGAVEGTYSYPLIKDTNLYIKVFSGYGESLIDYNNKLTKYSIGFSFSR